MQWNSPGPVAGPFSVVTESKRDLFETLRALHPELPSSYQRYFSQAECEESDEGVVISVPTTFQANGLQPLLATLEKAFNKPILSIQIRKPKASDSPVARTVQIQVPLPLTTRRAPEGPNPLEVEKEKRGIAPTLLISPAFAESNELLKRWSQGLNAGQRSQCVWIHGDSGSGKTSLVRQLNQWVRLEKKIISVDVMSFFHEWRRSIETKDQLSFIRKYRKEPDLLILENIDDLQGKPGTQQELLYTVSALLDRGASVAITSQKHPTLLQELIDPALYSRLHSGLAFGMPVPDRAFKEGLWRHLLAQHALAEAPIDLVILERIFAIAVNTARKTHSLFINVIGRLSYKQGLDMSDVSELIGKHAPATSLNVGAIRGPSDMMDQVAKVCGLGVSAIQGRVRRPDVCLARRFVCLALSRHCGLTNSVIANMVEKDPSTISHALKTIEEDIASNRRIAQQWNYICSQLGLPA